MVEFAIVAAMGATVGAPLGLVVGLVVLRSIEPAPAVVSPDTMPDVEDDRAPNGFVLRA